MLKKMRPIRRTVRRINIHNIEGMTITPKCDGQHTTTGIPGYLERLQRGFIIEQNAHSTGVGGRAGVPIARGTPFGIPGDDIEGLNMCFLEENYVIKGIAKMLKNAAPFVGVLEAINICGGNF